MTPVFMSFIQVLADYLIEIMGMVLAGALVFRLLASRAARRDQIYFLSFARAVEKTLDAENVLKSVEEEDIPHWVDDLLDKVLSQLPNRKLRFGVTRERSGEGSFRFREKEGFREFAEGKKSIVHGIRAHVDVLKAAHPPNFPGLARRILDQDRQWKTVGGVPVVIVSRVLEILPGLFVIGGILGTFIGISNGLPMIGKIDLAKINDSAPILASFMDNIALAMRTSIAGIMFSVAMTILNATFPIQAQRSDVEKSMSRCLELIWNRIHGETLNMADARIIELLTQLVEAGGGKPIAAAAQRKQTKVRNAELVQQARESRAVREGNETQPAQQPEKSPAAAGDDGKDATVEPKWARNGRRAA